MCTNTHNGNFKISKLFKNVILAFIILILTSYCFKNSRNVFQLSLCSRILHNHVPMVTTFKTPTCGLGSESKKPTELANNY